MIDRFVSEGVLIPDISCSHASPLVIVEFLGHIFDKNGVHLSDKRVKGI